MMKDKKKTHGQVFTPDYLVCQMLDFCGYYGPDILNKHVIDNSAGEGAFILEIVRRYCDEFYKVSDDTEQLKLELQHYIHAIEIDKSAYDRLKFFVTGILIYEYGITEDWNFDFINADAMEIDKFNEKMDFVIGNPPYIRVHNLDGSYDKVKTSKFCETGMTDLYLMFFELGLNMLSKNGVLCYVTPSSWIYSVAGKNFRNYLKETKSLHSIIDLGHHQAFDNATTYTMVTCITKDKKNETFKYYEFDEQNKESEYVDCLCIDDVDINGRFYMGTKKTINEIKMMYNEVPEQKVVVKNGFATLADKIFINDSFDLNKDYVIPVIKASTGKWSKAIYPYHKDYKPFELDWMKETYPELYDYFYEHKVELIKRDIDRNSSCFLYGRNQAVKDVYKDKVSINVIVKDIDSIKLNEVKCGSGVYSGIYILGDVSYDEIKNIVCTDEFIGYVKSLKKYKSGGYYTFSSKELERYINYKLSVKES